MLEVDHVHRSGASTADAGGATEHLVEQPLRVDADRERVAVAAVGPRHEVGICEGASDPGRVGFLADVQMRCAVHLRFHEQGLHELFKAPDERHPTVQLHVQSRFLRRRLA